GIDVPRQQKSLALELALGFRELCLGRRHARLCGTQRIELVLRIEPPHDLVRFEPIADIGRALDHAPPDAKGQTRFVLSLYSPVSPLSRLTTVTVRTGRTSGAAVSASGRQAASIAAASSRSEKREPIACPKHADISLPRLAAWASPPLYTKLGPFVWAEAAP